MTASNGQEKAWVTSSTTNPFQPHGLLDIDLDLVKQRAIRRGAIWKTLNLEAVPKKAALVLMT